VVVAAAFFYTLDATESPEDYIEKMRQSVSGNFNFIRFNIEISAHRFTKREFKELSFFQSNQLIG